MPLATLYQLDLSNGTALVKAADFNSWCLAKGIKVSLSVSGRRDQLQEWRDAIHDACKLPRVLILDWSMEDE